MRWDETIRRMSGNLVVALLSILFSLMIAETIFRALVRFDIIEFPRPSEEAIHQYSENRELVYELKPSASAKTIYGPVKTNQYGLRDYEYSPVKPPDAFRICVIGDSVTFGLDLAMEDTYPKILERMLNSTYGDRRRFEVINFAVAGYNSSQEEIVFKEKCLKFDPDMILVGFCLNDDSYTDGLGDLARELSPYSPGGRLHSKLVSYLLHRYERANYENWNDMGRVEHFFETLSKLKINDGLEAIILVFPYYFENLDSYSEIGMHKEVRNIAKRHDLSTMDFMDSWCEFDWETRESLYRANDTGHFSAKGMEEVATGVFEYLQGSVFTDNQGKWTILGGTYDTEDFEGLTQVPESESRKDFYKYYSGWMKYRGYVIARDLGVTMSKSIHPIPLGDYQVFLKVYDHEGQGSNQVEVTLNGMSQVVEWSGTEEGEKWVGATFENQGGGSELTITSLKREQWYIVILEVAVIPVDKSGEEGT